MDDIAGTVWVKTDVKMPGWLSAAGLPVLSDASKVKPNDCVICLTDDPSPPSQSESKAWFMNSGASRFFQLSVEELERRMRREGLTARLDKAKYAKDGHAGANRLFTVLVFDLHAADVRRKLYINRYNLLIEPDDHIRKIVSRAAVRALYLLNLDFGQVDVEIDEKGRAIIASVSPVVKPADREGKRRLSAAVTAFAGRWAAETSGGVAVTLGADPEFALLTPRGRIVSASRFFPTAGEAGCDSVVVRGVRRWPLAELRPAPAAEPAAVAEEIRRLLTAAARRIAGAPLTWRAGAVPVRGLPLGGHVHMSGAALTGERLRALDNAVALPLRLLEPPSASARRPRFGALGDFRRQSHGGFEYRTPPSWLVSPRLTKGVLALAKVAAVHARELSAYRPLDDDAVRDAFYTGDRALLKRAGEAFRNILALTQGYRKYEHMIEPLFNAIARDRTWDETADIRARWGIVK